MAATTPFASPSDPLVGARIDGRYVVHGVLGRGGMGVVYDGVHEQLGRAVAIKVLSAGTAEDPQSVERFLREARTASQLTHGNIIDVSDLGQLPDGRPYLVMPKIHGENLGALLMRQGVQKPARVVELLRGAASALDLIHAKGYVHRDVKPENLMHVVHEDGSEAVLLLDFGIVTFVEKQAARLTARGAIFGTPAYLAPEITKSDTPDRRVDVYSLATVAFELMTGRTPFEAGSPLRLVEVKSEREPPRMSSVCEHRFSEAVEAAVAQGLARDPLARHPSAGAFVRALDAAVRVGEPSAIPSSPRLPPGIATRAGSVAATAPAPDTRTEPRTPAGPPSAAPRNAAPRNAAPRSAAPRSAAPRSAAMDATMVVRRRVFRRSHAVAVLSVALAALAGGIVYQRSTRKPAYTEVVFQTAAKDLMPPVDQARSEARVESAQAPVTTLELPVQPSAEPAQEPAREPAPSKAPTNTSPALKPGLKGATRAAGSAQPKSTPPADTRDVRTEAQPSGGPSADELNKVAAGELLQGRLSRADVLYAQATRQEPRNAASWRGLGLTSERLGRKQEAMRAFRQALQLAPQGAQAESIRARLQKLEAAP